MSIKIIICYFYSRTLYTGRIGRLMLVFIPSKHIFNALHCSVKIYASIYEYVYLFGFRLFIFLGILFGYEDCDLISENLQPYEDCTFLWSYCSIKGPSWILGISVAYLCSLRLYTCMRTIQNT